MNVFARAWNAVGGRMLARTGRVGRLTTTGRRSGEPRMAYVGFASLADGRLVIGAGGEKRSWAANLKANMGSRGEMVTFTDVFQLTAEP